MFGINYFITVKKTQTNEADNSMMYDCVQLFCNGIQYIKRCPHTHMPLLS